MEIYVDAVNYLEGAESGCDCLRTKNGFSLLADAQAAESGQV